MFTSTRLHRVCPSVCLCISEKCRRKRVCVCYLLGSLGLSLSFVFLVPVYPLSSSKVKTIKSRQTPLQNSGKQTKPPSSCPTSGFPSASRCSYLLRKQHHDESAQSVKAIQIKLSCTMNSNERYQEAVVVLFGHWQSRKKSGNIASFDGWSHLQPAGLHISWPTSLCWLFQEGHCLT